MRRKTILLTTLCLILFALAKAQAPTPAFSAASVAGCSPLVVNFTDASTGNPTSWHWTFGNGATSDLQNPSTTYFTPGIYSVTLTVTNADGANSITRSNIITVYQDPVVDFKGSDSIGCYPFPVQFTDLTKATAGTTNTSWVWDLGDGTQSDLQNPKTTYMNSGNYAVSLKVTNDKGCWSVATKQGYIRIDGGVVSNFTFSKPKTCHTPFTIGFTNTSTGPGGLSYKWDFGDGATSTEANPSHTYTTTGVFSVMLVTESSNGCRDTMRKINLLNLQNTTTDFTAADSVCVKDAVSFTNTSSATAASLLWTFGDGTTAVAVSPVKTFTNPGTYTVRLTQTYGFCIDSASKTIQVLPRPTAGFTADKTIACLPPLTVKFQNTSTDAIAYQWIFGDGTTSTEANPSHTYTSYGNFEVKLIATNAYGCTDTMQLPGSVNVAKPVINFQSLPQNGCVPLTVSFKATVDAPDPVVSYQWNFGNGTTSTNIAPSAVYTEQGSYTVGLTITTANGCTETDSLPAAVLAGRKPVVKFNAMPNQVCAYQPVRFTNQTTDGTSWLWNFGDHTTATIQNGVHLYTDTGTFTIKLVADNYGCKDSLEIQDYITIKPPIARFSYKTSCNNKLFFTFKDASIGAKTWQWDFGDGTTSTQQNPTHTFSNYGTYTIQLTVTNDTCFHISKQVVTIVNGSPDFSASAHSVCQGTPISFTADSTNAANLVSYSWDFGNGGPTGSGMATSIVYPKAGIYNVTLTVTDINGCIESVRKPQFVQINGPTANFTAFNNNGCKGLQPTFTDASKSDGHSKIVKWQWALGDGTAVNDTTPVAVKHIYKQSGNYDVGLVVIDAAGCADTLNRPSLVHTSEIKADFVSADTISCPGADIYFTNKSIALTNYTSLWHFGDGATSTKQNPIASYKSDSLYSVQLKIRDAYGCTDSITKANYVSIKHPVASYTVSDTASSCIPLKVQFTNTSSYYTQYVWDLNGGTSRLANPLQYYNQPGTFKTKLIVTSPGGCTDTATQDITVYDMRSSKVTYLPLDGCKPLKVDLKAFSPVKMNFVWDFGDGTIISNNDTVTTHTYNFFGDFVPKVIMKDGQGCTVPVTGLDTINILGATAKFGLDKKSFCDSGLVRFSDSTTFNTPIKSYNWNFGDGTTSTEASPSHRYTRPGNYPAFLTVLTESRCVDTFRLRSPIKVVASPAVGIDGDSVICAGEGILHVGIFERPDTSIVQWAWTFPNGRTATVQMPPRQYYKEAGRFAVEAIATNSSGCRDTAYQDIRVNPIPSVTLPSTITTMVGTPVLIPALYSDTMQLYRWTVPDGLNCSTCPRPMANPKLNTRYTVQFEDRNGCRNTGDVQVIVLCNNDNVFVPNTFSPNGDGSNDVFYVRGKGLSRVKSLRIFNRWGQIVFEKVNFNVNDASVGWDGTFKGAKPIPDVYVYQIEIFCDNSEVIKFEGNVALIQ
jgi:gliding motility-associated-like protein